MSGIFPGQSGNDAGWSAADFVALSLPRLPEKLTPLDRNAAYTVAAYLA